MLKPLRTYTGLVFCCIHRRARACYHQARVPQCEDGLSEI